MDEMVRRTGWMLLLYEISALEDKTYNADIDKDRDRDKDRNRDRNRDIDGNVTQFFCLCIYIYILHSFPLTYFDSKTTFSSNVNNKLLQKCLLRIQNVIYFYDI